MLFMKLPLLTLLAVVAFSKFYYCVTIYVQLHVHDLGVAAR